MWQGLHVLPRKGKFIWKLCNCEELLELIGYVLANTLNKYISWLNGLWLNTYSSLPVYLAPQRLQCHVPQWPVHMRWMRIWSCLWRGHWKGCPASSPDHLSHWYFQQCHTCQKYFKVMSWIISEGLKWVFRYCFSMLYRSVV